jgi:hypothetical protein
MGGHPVQLSPHVPQGRSQVGGVPFGGLAECSGLGRPLLPCLGGLMIRIWQRPVRQPDRLLSPEGAGGRGRLSGWAVAYLADAGTGARRPLRVGGRRAGPNDLQPVGVMACLRRGARCLAQLGRPPPYSGGGRGWGSPPGWWRSGLGQSPPRRCRRRGPGRVPVMIVLQSPPRCPSCPARRPGVRGPAPAGGTGPAPDEPERQSGGEQGEQCPADHDRGARACRPRRPMRRRRSHDGQRAEVDPRAGCARGQLQDPARLDQLGTGKPPAVRLRPALVQVEDLHEPAAVAESLGRNGEQRLGVAVPGWRDDVELDRCR